MGHFVAGTAKVVKCAIRLEVATAPTVAEARKVF